MINFIESNMSAIDNIQEKEVINLKNKHMTKQEQKDKAYAEYQAIIEPACKKYRATREQAFKEYRATREQANKEYQSKCNEIDEQDIKIIDGKKYKLVD